MSQYLAIGQVCIARDVAELFIAKFANVALQLKACEGACHAPEADVPSPCTHTSRSVALVKERKKEKTLLLGMFQGKVTVSPSFPLAEAQHSEGKGVVLWSQALLWWSPCACNTIMEVSQQWQRCADLIDSTGAAVVDRQW